MQASDTYFAKAEEVIMDVLLKVRPELMAAFGNIDYTHKEDKTVVTELDKKVELQLKEALKVFDPEAGFLGEEDGQEGSKEQFWTIDPIDGTEQFIRGMPACRTLISFISGGEPVYALAYRFTTQDLFTAEKGKGTKKNGEPIKLNPRPLDRSWVEMATEFRNPHFMKAAAELDQHVNCIIYTKEFLNVIEGFVDIYAVLGGRGQFWDYAPRALLMSEAGLKIGNWGSDTYDPNNLSLVAAAPELFDHVQKLLSP